jgi:hypothetical protein
MRKLCGYLVPLFLLPMPALAQNTPSWQVFGGYSHWVGSVNSNAFNLNGIDLSLNQNLNRWFGGVLDVNSDFGTEAGSKVNTQSITYGPVFSYRKNPNVVPFAEALVGAARGSSEYLDISKSEYRWAYGGGGGVDVKLKDQLYLRVIRVDYLETRFSGVGQSNIRISAGLVFNFGKR